MNHAQRAIAVLILILALTPGCDSTASYRGDGTMQSGRGPYTTYAYRVCFPQRLLEEGTQTYRLSGVPGGVYIPELRLPTIAAEDPVRDSANALAPADVWFTVTEAKTGGVVLHVGGPLDTPPSNAAAWTAVLTPTWAAGRADDVGWRLIGQNSNDEFGPGSLSEPLATDREYVLTVKVVARGPLPSVIVQPGLYIKNSRPVPWWARRCH
jgi:hypothetical protein